MKKLITDNWIKIADNKNIGFVKSGINKFENEKVYLDTASVSKYSIVDETYFVTYNNRPSRANMQPKPNTVWFAKLKNSPKYIIVKDFSKDLLENKIFSTGFCGLKIKDEMFNLLSIYIISEDFNEKKDLMSVGATMQSVNNSEISNITIPQFETKDFLHFNSFSDPLLNYINNLEEENKKLHILKDLYLKKFFN